MKKVNSIIVTRAFNRYLNSTDTNLDDIYSRHSHAKAQAYNRCVRLMHEYDGKDLRIISHNTNKFTVGFTAWVNNELCFFYITADYDKYMSFADIDRKLKFM